MSIKVLSHAPLWRYEMTPEQKNPFHQTLLSVACRWPGLGVLWEQYIRKAIILNPDRLFITITRWKRVRQMFKSAPRRGIQAITLIHLCNTHRDGCTMLSKHKGAKGFWGHHLLPWLLFSLTFRWVAVETSESKLQMSKVSSKSVRLGR